MCPVLASPVQRRGGATGASAVEGPKDNKGTGASFIKEEAERAGTQNETNQILSEHKKIFFSCEGGQMLEQVAWNVGGVSILRVTQNTSGHSACHLALADIA